MPIGDSRRGRLSPFPREGLPVEIGRNGREKNFRSKKSKWVEMQAKPSRNRRRRLVEIGRNEGQELNGLDELAGAKCEGWE